MQKRETSRTGMEAEIPTFGERYRAKLEHLTIEVQAFPERWGYRVIDQNVNPENISFLLMWPASLEESKVQATKDALSRLGKPAKPAKVKAEVKKLYWECYQAFPQRLQR